ncbi:hypothetical protein V7128_01390 [Neobacillus vireti]|uniref:hypothetical protein n=1 Tax=Neobacillus vireti TaxID=220686 RepID=UPI00300055F7
MGVNISQIINKFLPTKRVDDDLRENPFNTAVGQEVVSEEENFWSRKLRYGRTAYKMWNGVTLGNAGVITASSAFYPKVNKIFIPRLFTFSATVDVTLRFMYLPYKNFDTYDTSSVEYLFSFNLPANQPFKHEFNGELEIQGDGAGYIAIQMTPVSTAGGKAEFSIWGIEVSQRA